MRLIQRVGYQHLVMALSVLAVSCNEPNTYVPSVTDTFTAYSNEVYSQASQVKQADFVFVLNTSYSMQPFRQNLFSNLEDFAATLRTQSMDYRIGLIQGNRQSTAGTTYNAKFIENRFLQSGQSPQLESQIVSLLSDIANPLKENDTWLLENTRLTLNAQGSQFLRTGAQLVYVFVSDDDDKKSPLTTNYVSALKSYKTDPAFISARAIVMDDSVSSTCKPITIEGQGPATRLVAVAKELENNLDKSNVVRTVCESFSNTLDNLARTVTRLTDKFTLQQRPVPLSVEVLVNGSLVSSSGNWTYDTATNQVIFSAGREPAWNASLEIKYDVYFNLSQSPRGDSIEVRVNNAQISRNDSNGWSYVGGENRIQFNGSSRPTNGSEIRVIYQVQ